MGIRTIEVSGEPRAMGRQYGEELRDLARLMVGTRLELAARAASRLDPARDMAWCLDLAAEALPPLEEYSPPVYEELQGIADGTGLTLPELVIGNGWTDFKDLIEARGAAHNCTSLVVEGSLTADGHTLLAQTWDMNVTAAPYTVLVRRKPSAGPQTLSLTTAGCLSLIGLNEHGLAIGNTNLTPTDARPGVFYLALIHEALRQRTLEAAAESVTRAGRMSGHYYYLGDADERFVGIETTAATHALVHATDGRYAHTNHYVADELLQSGLTTPAGANTVGRQEACEALLGSVYGNVTVTDISQIMSHHDGEHPICRHAQTGGEYATLAAAVLSPATRTMWISAGNPCCAPAEGFTL